MGGYSMRVERDCSEMSSGQLCVVPYLSYRERVELDSVQRDRNRVRRNTRPFIHRYPEMGAQNTEGRTVQYPNQSTWGQLELIGVTIDLFPPEVKASEVKKKRVLFFMQA